MANEKILIADDDKNICELLRLYLTKEGYQVTVIANDGEEAVVETFESGQARHGAAGRDDAQDGRSGRCAAASARRATPR